jgi:hypothetical protein
VDISCIGKKSLHGGNDIGDPGLACASLAHPHLEGDEVFKADLG